MKKILPLILVFAIVAAPLWAKKDKQKKQAPEDPYSDKILKPQSERSFGQKLLGLDKFQDIDDFSLYVKGITGKPSLRKKAQLVHRAGTELGGFFCYYDSSCYAIQLAKQDRNLLIEAVNKYFEDFENKNLKRGLKQSATESVYGVAKCYEESGVTIINMTRAGKPNICFGYEFLKENPYFCIYVKKTKDLNYTKKTDDNEAWGEIIAQRYYFTKAQARALAEFLSDENINRLYEETTPKESEILEDEYDDGTETTKKKKGKKSKPLPKDSEQDSYSEEPTSAPQDTDTDTDTNTDTNTEEPQESSDAQQDEE